MHTCSHNVLSLPSRAVKQVYIFTVAASKASLLLCVCPIHSLLLLFSGMTWCVFFYLISNTLPAAFYGWAWMSNINFHISLFQITSTLHVTVASLLKFLISIVHLQKCYIKKKSTCYYFLLSLKVIPKPLLSCQGGTQSCDYWYFYYHRKIHKRMEYHCSILLRSIPGCRIYISARKAAIIELIS